MEPKLRYGLDEAVAEHAISFYFALRRNLVGMHAKMVDGKEEWKSKGSLISYVSLSLLVFISRAGYLEVITLGKVHIKKDLLVEHLHS